MNIKVNKEFINLEKLRDTIAREKRYSKLKNTYKYAINPDDLNSKIFWNQKINSFRTELSFNKVYLDKIRIVAKLIKSIQGKMLDVGIGYGDLERQLMQNSSIEIYGIDIAEVAIKYANKNLEGTYKVSSIFKIPYASEFFNAVVCLDVLEHIPANKVMHAYREIKRVIKKEGVFIFSIPINEGLDKMLLSRRNPNGHMRIYTESLIEAEMLINGFQLVSIKLLYAFKDNYELKKTVIKLFPRIFKKKPNLLIGIARKK